MSDKISDILFSPISLKDLETLIENCVRRVLSEIEEKEAEDNILNVEQASKFLNLQRATVYGMTSRREIPFIKKSKKLYFSKDDLTAWLKTSAKKVKK